MLWNFIDQGILYVAKAKNVVEGCVTDVSIH